jgi:hypothetical protein
MNPFHNYSTSLRIITSLRASIRLCSAANFDLCGNNVQLCGHVLIWHSGNSFYQACSILVDKLVSIGTIMIFEAFTE